MSIVSLSSTLKEVPNVNAAVDHLQELGQRMISAEFGFGEQDVENIDFIVDAIKDLEMECGKLHDKVETETIHASILRRQLLLFPGKIKAEIKALTGAARDSNEDVMVKQREQLSSIKTHISAMEEEVAGLEEENARLLPERDKLREDHEEVIATLNQRMAEKAGKQIKLNETRDQLRETNLKIIDLEEGVVNLKEDLIQERAEARIEKKHLKKAVYDATMKNKEQKEINIAKKKEVDALTEQVEEGQSKLDVIREKIQKLESSLRRHEHHEKTLTETLTREQSQNEKLRNKNAGLKAEMAKQETEWEAKLAALRDNIHTLENNIRRDEALHKTLTAKRKELVQDVLPGKQAKRKADAELVQAHVKALDKLKQELAWKSEEIARLQGEIEEMDVRLEELEASHEAIVATVQKQIARYREQLGKVRGERLDLQKQRDDVQKGLDDFRVGSNKYMHDIARVISECKLEVSNLTEERESLTKTLEKEATTLTDLTQQLSANQKAFKEMKEELLQRIKTLKEEIDHMQTDLVDKTQQIEEKQEPFLEFEKYFEEKMAEFAELKKELLDVKHTKLRLTESVKMTQKELDKQVIPRQILESELKTRRARYLEQRREHMEATAALERDMYTVTCRLTAATGENDKFIKSNGMMEESMVAMETQIQKLDREFTEMTAELQAFRDMLTRLWKEDGDLQQEFTRQGGLLLEEFSHLLAENLNREEVTGHVVDRLRDELILLAEFLENVARRRPKTSGKSTKSASQGRKPATPGSARPT